MNEDFLKIVGIVVIISILIFLAIKLLKVQVKVMEGLTNSDESGSSASNSNNNPKNGEAGSANQYANDIENKNTKLEDGLLIPKYRTDYEQIILNMDDYINILMLKTILNININDDNVEGNKPNSNTALFESLNTLNNAKTSLNNVMKFVDKK